MRLAQVDVTQSTVEFSFPPGPMLATEQSLTELPTMRQLTPTTAELERPLSVMSLPDPPHGSSIANIPSRPDTTDIGDHPHTAGEDFHIGRPTGEDALSRQTTPLVETTEAPLRTDPVALSCVNDTGEPRDAPEMAAELSLINLVTDRPHPSEDAANEERPFSPGSLEDPQSEAGDPSPPVITLHQVPTELRPAEAEETSAASTMQREPWHHSEASPVLPQSPVNNVATADAAAAVTAAAELERAAARKSQKASITSWNVPRARRGMCRTVAERAPLVMKGPQRVSHAGPPLLQGVPAPPASRKLHQGKLRTDRDEPLRAPSVSAGPAARSEASSDSLGGVLSVASKPSSTRRS